MATTKHTTRTRRELDDATVREQDAIIEQALRILESRARTPGKLIDNFDTAANWFRLKLGNLPREVFTVAWLNRQQRLIAFQELFPGTVDRSTIHPREVVRYAIHHNAMSCLFAHNHPSGSPEASRADAEITGELAAALRLIGVQVLDHFVVTAKSPPFSMAKHGMLTCGIMRLGPKQNHYKILD